MAPSPPESDPGSSWRTSKPLVGILGDVDGRIVPVAPPPVLNSVVQKLTHLSDGASPTFLHATETMPKRKVRLTVPLPPYPESHITRMGRRPGMAWTRDLALALLSALPRAAPQLDRDWRKAARSIGGTNADISYRNDPTR